MLKRRRPYRVVLVENQWNRSAQRERGTIAEQCPKGWNVVLLGEAVGVGQRTRTRRGRKIPGSVRYAREYLAYDAKRVELIERRGDPIPAGAEPVGTYGEVFVTVA